MLGASAGGVEALTAVARGLPGDLAAAVLVVLHVPPLGSSALPSLLNRAGSLPAAHASDGEPIRRGRIYVAPPDHHLIVREDKVHLGRGPTENGHRPAVDPLFRSAALAYGPRCIGVLLSGALDDGTAGLIAIKESGGLAVVQDPVEALYSSMPGNALKHVTVDHVAAAAELGAVLCRLVGEPIAAVPAPPDAIERKLGLEVRVAADDLAAADALTKHGTPSVFACPDCHGVLWAPGEGEQLRFRCRVGHAYEPESLGMAQSERLEEALWTAFRALKESAALAAQLASRASSRGLMQLASEYTRRQGEAEQRAELVEEVLQRGRLSAATEGADLQFKAQAKRRG